LINASIHIFARRDIFLKPTNFLRIVALAAAGLCALAVGTPAGVTVDDCATCHRSIHDEWSGSLHSQGWTSPLFTGEYQVRATAGASSCACHAPEGVAGLPQGSVPAAREESPHSGVDCLSCHVDSSGTIWGTGETLYVPHFTRREPSYSTAAACAPCHPLARGSEYDCQLCHMPDQSGPPAAGPHLEQTAGATHRSHRIVGSRDPEMAASGVSLEVKLVGDNVKFEVTNLVDAHELPANKRRGLLVALCEPGKKTPLWNELIKLEPGGSVELSAPRSGATVAELRFYPSTEVWPDSFYVLQREPLN
jgi:hypothetical protein